MFNLKDVWMFIFKTYIDFISEKPEPGRAALVEPDSLVFNDAKSISTNCVVTNMHSLW